MNCIFCKIISEELTSSVVNEDTLTLAFLDIHPVNPGHTLIVPKRHVESYVDLTKDEASQMAVVAQIIAEKLKQNIKDCEGVNLSLADGVVAGQEVPHAHLHVIPRIKADGFGWKFPPDYSNNPKSKEELDLIAEQIRESINKK